MSVILYLVWCILQVPSTALIFLKMFYILWFVFLWNHWWRHQFLNKNLNISGMRSNISKTETPFFFCSKGLPNELHLFFYFISTLTGSDLNRLSCWTHNSNISLCLFKVRVNPNKQAFSWVASGGAAGLARIHLVKVVSWMGKRKNRNHLDVFPGLGQFCKNFSFRHANISSEHSYKSSALCH